MNPASDPFEGKNQIGWRQVVNEEGKVFNVPIPRICSCGADVAYGYGGGWWWCVGCWVAMGLWRKRS